MIANLHSSEADFHDDWAESVDLEKIDIHAAFVALTAPENRFISRKLGPVVGKHILDVGSGLGESAVHFALQGAQVTFCDVSQKMVDLALRLGKHHGVSLKGTVGAVEELDFKENSFDVVYMANVLHHIQDRQLVFQKAARWLKPKGRFFSWDPLGYNPVIDVYRRMASRFRTPDERPLTFSDHRLLRRTFPDAGHREFWIASLLLFIKYFLLDRVHPSSQRYWKRILSETPQSLWWWRPLLTLDAGLTRLPLVRRLAWNMVMWGSKP